jgi:hypothetical protein
MITVPLKIFFLALLVGGGAFAVCAIRLRFARITHASGQTKWLILTVLLMLVLLGVIFGLKVDSKTAAPIYQAQAPRAGGL